MLSRGTAIALKDTQKIGGYHSGFEDDMIDMARAEIKGRRKGDAIPSQRIDDDIFLTEVKA